jgi:hypothetical protein
MEGLRQSSVVKRIAFGVIAIYAFLLQGFLTSTAAISTFDAPAGISCAANDSAPGAPGGAAHGHPGLCCILTCVAACCAYVDSAVGLTYFPPRVGKTFVFAEGFAAEDRRSLRFYFAARAPPQRF